MSSKNSRIDKLTPLTVLLAQYCFSFQCHVNEIDVFHDVMINYIIFSAGAYSNLAPAAYRCLYIIIKRLACKLGWLQETIIPRVSKGPSLVYSKLLSCFLPIACIFFIKLQKFRYFRKLTIRYSYVAIFTRILVWILLRNSAI